MTQHDQTLPMLKLPKHYPAREIEFRIGKWFLLSGSFRAIVLLCSTFIYGVTAYLWMLTNT